MPDTKRDTCDASARIISELRRLVVHEVSSKNTIQTAQRGRNTFDGLQAMLHSKTGTPAPLTRIQMPTANESSHNNQQSAERVELV